MDVKKPANNKRRYKRIALTAASVGGVAALGWVAFALANRPPGVEQDQVLDSIVTRGEFIHEVTASGVLFATDIRKVTTRSEGTIERVHVLAGRTVKPDDVLIELSSLNLAQDLVKAKSTLAAAENDEIIRRADADSSYLNLLVNASAAEAEYTTAQIELEGQTKLREAGATSALEYQRVVSRTDNQRRRFEAAQAQVDRYPETREARNASAQAKLDQLRREVTRLEELIVDLSVRAGFAGIVQTIDAEVGQRVAANKDFARIINPNALIARVRVSERDAALVQEGQPVRLEMGRQTLQGHVTRVEPTVRDRLVTVDVGLDGEDRTGLRPDLTVTARIEIARSLETLVLDRPPGLRDDQKTVELFRLDEDGGRARRVSVEIARVSPRQVEIARGLAAGDRVITSDMTEWAEEPEVRIR